MKKNKFSEFFKGKGYYVLLFVGVIAIAAVALIGSQLSSSQNKDGQQNEVDLNDTDNNIAAGDSNDKLAENNPVSDGVVNNANNPSTDTATNDKVGQDVASNDAELEDFSQKPDSGAAQTAGTDVAQAEETVETAGGTVQADNTAALESLSFKTEEGLLWPVSGNVIMDYSMDHTTYFATLLQYKCNPAVIFAAEVGTEVKAATDGIITSIVENEETGYTITMSIGDGYSVIYGQLNEESVSFKVGDSVKEGDIIGKIDEPSKYYTVEGSNLYFEVMKDDQTVNPMLLLR